MALLSLLASGVGLAQGIGNNRRAQQQGDQALGLQRQNQQLALAEQARLAEVRRQLLGQIDPAAQVAASREAYAANQALSLQNLGGALRTAGYQPGDSAILSGGLGLTRRGLAQQAQQEQAIRQNAIAQQAGIAQLGSPNGVMAANAGYANALNQNAQQYRTDYGGLLAGLGQTDLGFLKPRNGANANTGYTQYAAPAGPVYPYSGGNLAKGFLSLI